VTAASNSRLGRRYAQDLSMGLSRRCAPGLSGVGVRAVHLREQPAAVLSALGEFMNAESWAEIPIAPITARFEGTATIRG